jgi:hypothetical protein
MNIIKLHHLILEKNREIRHDNNKKGYIFGRLRHAGGARAGFFDIGPDLHERF